MEQRAIPADRPTRDVDSPETQGQYVRDEQRRQEDLEEVGRENASLLHHPGVPHAEGARPLRVSEQELSGRGRGHGIKGFTFP